MCGIVGVVKYPSVDLSPEILKKMVTDVTHRGPDDGGLLFFQEASVEGWTISSETDHAWAVALGSRRLSIQDLSAAGHMPLSYRDRYWIVYNGEIYNFLELRAELETLGYTFRSLTDTETILAAYAAWGTDCFEHFRGMWGLIIFDSVQKELVICRDRLGIKPLYLWQAPGIVAIVSEIKQLFDIPMFSPRMNLAAAAEYLRTGYENTEQSFFRDVQPFPAGRWLRLPLNTLIPSTPNDYWHPERVGVSITNAEEAGKLFADKLRESISIHLRSDVPVGCALSGGLDSSSIATLIDETRGSGSLSLHTFSCTFPGDPLNEQEYIEAVNAKIQVKLGDKVVGGETVLACSSFFPKGKVEVVPGGYRVTGQWPFASGSSFCRWATIGSHVPSPDPDAPPIWKLFIVPAEDYTLVDTWRTFGLRATGSNDVRVDGAFVPEHRTWDIAPGLMVAPDNGGPPLYRLPWLYMFTSCISNLYSQGRR